MTIAAHRIAVANADPTRTIGLRARWIADASRRYRNLMSVIRTSVVDRDALGLAELSPLFGLAAEPTPPSAFAYLRDPQKMDAFMAWLGEQEKAGILEIIPGPAGPEPWSNQHIRSGYQRGIESGLAKLRRKGFSIPTTTLPGPGNVMGVFYQPFHQERVQLIYQRVFTKLEGVTRTMDAQISEVLASGMIEGIGPEAMAERMVSRVDKIGLTRSKLIARTEVVQAFNQAAVGEFGRASAVMGEEVLVEWYTARDERVRSSHRIRHGKIFTREDGLSLTGEPNCLVGDSMVRSPSDLERVYERFYNGDIIVLETASGDRLTCTPNHPILTPAGFVPAGSLYIGCDVMRSAGTEPSVAVGENEEDIEAPIHEVARAFSLSADMSFTPTVGMDFHGDGIDGQIAVVWTDRELRDGIKTKIVKHADEFFLKWGRMQNAFLASFGSEGFPFRAVSVSTPGNIGGGGLPLALDVGHGGPFKEFRLGLGSGLARVSSEDGIDHSPSQARGFVDGVGRHSGIEHLNYPGMGNDRIVGMGNRHFSGHVYNLQTGFGSYIAQNIIVGNCRCALLPYIESVDGPARVSSAGSFRRAA